MRECYLDGTAGARCFRSGVCADTLHRVVHEENPSARGARGSEKGMLVQQPIPSPTIVGTLYSLRRRVVRRRCQPFSRPNSRRSRSAGQAFKQNKKPAKLRTFTAPKTREGSTNFSSLRKARCNVQGDRTLSTRRASASLRPCVPFFRSRKGIQRKGAKVQGRKAWRRGE